MAISDELPQTVKITGWLSAAVGILSFFNGLSVFVASYGMNALVPDVEDESVPAVIKFMFLHFSVFGAVQAISGVVLAAAGIALSHGREWGRRVVLVFVYISIAWAVLFATQTIPLIIVPAGAWPRAAVRVFVMLAGSAFIAVGIFLLYLVIRWLQSPTIKQACGGKTATAAPERDVGSS